MTGDDINAGLVRLCIFASEIFLIRKDKVIYRGVLAHCLKMRNPRGKG